MFNYLEAEATLEWLAEMDHSILVGPDNAHDGVYPERDSYHDVVLTERLREAIVRINKDVPREAIDLAVQRIEANESPDVVINNQKFHQMVTEGIDIQLQGQDGYNPTVKVWLFDFENSQNNDFVGVNQFTVIEGNQNMRPDVLFCEWLTFSCH